MSTPVPQRKIGHDNVPAISFGAMLIPGFLYGGACKTDEERFEVLDRLLEIGCTHWDVAPVYLDCEEIVGRWFAKTGNRKKIFLTTKFGIMPDISIRGDPEHVKESLEASLEKLQTDYVDLLYQHRSDGNVPVEITVRAMKEFVDEGKVRYLGLSEASPDTMRRAHKEHPMAAIEIEYSPWEQADEVIATARELGIAIVAAAPLGRSLLTDRFKTFDDLPENDVRRAMPRYAAKNWPKIVALREEFARIGEQYKATSAQIALAWLLAQGDDIIPIPGSSQIKNIEENFAAANIKLKGSDLQELNRLSSQIADELRADPRAQAGMLEHLYQETPPLPA